MTSLSVSARLQSRPIAASMVYAIVGSFPLFLAGAYAVRLQDDLGLSTAQFGWVTSAYFAVSTLDRRARHRVRVRPPGRVLVLVTRQVS